MKADLHLYFCWNWGAFTLRWLKFVALRCPECFPIKILCNRNKFRGHTIGHRFDQMEVLRFSVYIYS